MISVLSLTKTQGRLAVGIVLAQDAVFLTAEGDPTPKVALSAANARDLANPVLSIVRPIENGKAV